MLVSRFARRLLCIAAGAGLFAGLVATAPTAGAVAGRPHDPIGTVSSVKAAARGVAVTGWAIDPDARTSNLTIAAMVDGRRQVATVHTSVANAAVRTKYHAGATPGFAMTVPVGSGAHTVCIVARNRGAGLAAALRCFVTPLGTRLSTAQLARHNPVGAFSAAWVGSSTFRVRGWSSDPDWVNHGMTVVLYVDGHPARTVTTWTFHAPRPAAAGGWSLFDFTVPVISGTHNGCLWVVNVGLGHNTFLGCRTLDTRGRAGSGALRTPALNTKVLAEAKRHIGQPYVWGAEGPKKFDCSGLVWYSYHKYGFTPLRVSEDQFTQARLIPASRAVPGDLVFYHDSEGDVYHVGIYLSPGKTVAAVDPQEGVTYQYVWDPSITTYGSFTHT